MTLRERCQTVASKLQRDAMLRQGSPVETLLEFVLSEQGRAADNSLTDAAPLVLYFANPEDREEFIATMKSAKPNMIAKRMP